jgi:hypothetical protein
LLVKEKLRLLIIEGRKKQFITIESSEFTIPAIKYDEIFQNSEKKKKKLFERGWQFFLPSSAVFYYTNIGTRIKLGQQTKKT